MDDSVLLFGVTFLFVVFVIAVYVIFGRRSSSRAKGDKVLLIGLPGAGKTHLFQILRTGKQAFPTVTSMKENTSKIRLGELHQHIHLSKETEKSNQGGPSRKTQTNQHSPTETTQIVNSNVEFVLVDVPGHNRLRNRMWSYIDSVALIVFLIDAVSFKQEQREIAQFLKELFQHPKLNERNTPVVICCNKMDSFLASTKKFIKKELEKEINHVRTLQKISSVEGEEAETVFLGQEDKPFQFEHLPMTVTVEEISVKDSNISPMISIIQQRFSS